MISSLLRRRTKPKTAAAVYRLTTGAWGLPTDGVPDFGPKAPSDAIRTERVVKDVLTVGRKKIGFDKDGQPVFWDVTPATLAQIANDFKAMKAAGNAPNLGKTHGDDDLLIHPDDLIAPLDQVLVANNTLWASAYVTPEEVAYLLNPARKVSVGVVPEYVDGAGNKYSLALIHVAVTDRPVVLNQGPFVTLADGTGGSSMNPDLLDAINMLMEAAGLGQLGEVTDEAALVEQLKGVAAALGKTADTSSADDSAAAGGTVTPTATAGDLPMPQMPAGMANSIKLMLKNELDKRDAQIKTLSDELAAREKAAVDSAKAAFTAKVNELTAAGVPKVTLDAKVALANELATKGVKHDLRLLDGLAPVLNRGGAARALASGNPPPTAGGQASTEDANKEVAQRIAARRGITLENALKLIPN